jgi:hypothetical protein
MQDIAVRSGRPGAHPHCRWRLIEDQTGRVAAREPVVFRLGKNIVILLTYRDNGSTVL